MEKDIMSNVALMTLSMPSAISNCHTSEEFIAYAARVSNPSNQNNKETAPKLLKYLIKNKHWSPFECVSATLEIQTTRDISRQILRHRSFSFQEFSQRYAVSQNFELREARLQDETNRQNSIDTNDEVLKEWWEVEQTNLLKDSQQVYNMALDRGIAKEQARAVLPEGLTNTTLYMSGTLRSWIHYIQLRTDSSTQKEHREVALKCKDVLSTHFPIIMGLLNEL
jgi:thymidylate synthase (FAD)